MRIEFSLVGDGTNIQVELIERLNAESEQCVDRFYSQQHHFELRMDFDEPLCAWDSTCFPILEEQLLPPFIGGELAQFHPYWEERKKRRAAAQLLPDRDYSCGAAFCDDPACSTHGPKDVDDQLLYW
jgi:hypothetical protein